MAYYQTYPQYQEQPQVFIASDAYGYGQPTGNAQRSKTPASLINHTGHSPGPLSTPPPLSRNASQGPEQLPAHAEQMVYDDAFGNYSDSPTSVRTPDDNNFEVEMLDSQSLRDFYQTQNGAISTDVSQGGLPAFSTTTFMNAPYPDHGGYTLHPRCLVTMLTPHSTSSSPQCITSFPNTAVTSTVHHAISSVTKYVIITALQ